VIAVCSELINLAFLSKDRWDIAAAQHVRSVFALTDCSRLPVDSKAFCVAGECISAAVLCNGNPDCPDASDERACC